VVSTSLQIIAPLNSTTYSTSKVNPIVPAVIALVNSTLSLISGMKNIPVLVPAYGA